ncbi:MAG: hypothetical protein ACREO7_14595 [Pseudoxanthomonas sp.]
MDALEFAAVSRAHAALTAISGNRDADHRAQARAFQDLAWVMLRAEKGEVGAALRSSGNPLVTKAAAHSLGDAIWGDGDAAALAASYLASISEFSILDSVKRFASILPIQTARVMVAADAVGDVVAEGDPKPVRKLSLSMSGIEPTKAVGIVVITQDLANATGGEGRRLFESELANAVTRASNRSILTALDSSDTIAVAGTGDPLADLRAGLRAAGPSNGYVVAGPAGDVADLATRIEATGGMGVRGGNFRPGIEVVAVDDLAGMHIIPASRLAVWDGGLQVRSAGHATLDMRDTPESPAQMVSLWQTNSLGILLERSWHLAQSAEIVVVGGES